MTQEEKQLLLVDLCARLPYDVIVRCYFVDGGGEEVLDTDDIADMLYKDKDNEFPMYKPYLRPMSSMTEEELNELLKFEDIDYNNNGDVVKRAMMAFSEDKKIESNSLFCIQYARSIDWLNAHHFDYRGLIPIGLALEAPKGMYKTE